MEPKSPLDTLSDTIESALAARRAKVEERVRGLEALVTGYRRAVETEIAREFAAEHGFKQAPAASPTAARAAELLLDAVSALPELEDRAPVEGRAEEQVTPNLGATVAGLGPEIVAGAMRQGHPRLSQELVSKKLVVIGGISRRDKSSAFPETIAARCEWIDTEHDGAHAIGNLPQRVRQGRVAAVVILHRAVQHRHTEAVVAAARDAGVPIAFAGQGGKASLLRALAQVEASLESA
jgi:hypothetical protein